MASLPFLSPKAESAEDAEARRDAERDARREEARRWYAKLPYVVVAAICSAVLAIVVLLTLLSRLAPVRDPKPEIPKAGASAPAEAQPKPPAAAASQVIGIGARQLFDFDSDRLKLEAADTAWGQLRQCLESPTLVSIRIVGHSDCIGSPQYNLDLSQRRANAVREWIEANSRVAVRITAEGEGAREAQLDPRCRPPMRARLDSVRLLERFRRVDVVCELLTDQPPQRSAPTRSAVVTG